MSLIDPIKTANHISNWIKEYATKAGVKDLVFGSLTKPDDINDTLVAYLCENTGLNLHFCSDPIFYAEQTSGIIVGSLNRNQYDLVRAYHKHKSRFDLLPIADLFQSEIREMFLILSCQKQNPHLNFEKYIPEPELLAGLAPHNKEIYLFSTGDKELRSGITYNEVEWADRENERTHYHNQVLTTVFDDPGIVENDQDPVRHLAWVSYTGRQKVVIAKIHAIEKATRHKINNNLPVCRIRNTTEGLVR